MNWGQTIVKGDEKELFWKKRERKGCVREREREIG